MERVVAKLEGVTISADTAAGAAYVKKVTHPPTMIPENYQGVPDCSAPNVVPFETKSESNFPAQIVLPTGATTSQTLNSSSMMFVSPSGGQVATYCFQYVNSGPTIGWVQPVGTPLGTNPIAQPCPPAQNNQGYNWGNLTSDAAQMRTTYKSETYYLNATAFNDQGTVTSAKFKPDIINTTFTATWKQFDRESRASLLRALKACNAKVFFKKKDYVAVNKKGDDISDDLEVDFDTTPDYAIQFWQLQPNTAGAIAPIAGSPMYTLNGILPANASEVLNFSSKAATRPAKEGAFVVHQPIGPVQPWTALPSGVASGIQPIQQSQVPVISLLRIATYPTGGVTFQVAPLFNIANALPNPAPQTLNTDAPWNNLDWTMTLFEGLTIPAAGSSTTSIPYITVKAFAGIEVSPQVHSSLLPFARLLPLPDHKAIEMSTGIHHARPDSLPASANDFGASAVVAGASALAPLIIKHIPAVVDWMKNVFSKPPPPKPVQKQPVQVVTRVVRSSARPAAAADTVSHVNARTSAQKLMIRQRNLASRLSRIENGRRPGYPGDPASALPSFVNNNNASLGAASAIRNGLVFVNKKLQAKPGKQRK